jgi:hypothetical protein
MIDDFRDRVVDHTTYPLIAAAYARQAAGQRFEFSPAITQAA